jgi:hypothetical protein
MSRLLLSCGDLNFGNIIDAVPDARPNAGNAVRLTVAVADATSTYHGVPSWLQISPWRWALYDALHDARGDEKYGRGGEMEVLTEIAIGT